MDNLIVVAEMDNEIEARVLADILNERQIPHIIKAFVNDYYGSLFQLGRGWGQLLAPDSYKEEIAQILAHLRE